MSVTGGKFAEEEGTNDEEVLVDELGADDVAFVDDSSL
jgi:hypothetical protein